MSTYALMSLCNSAIIYGTKMGVELTSVGLPVVVAGEAWIRNKGLTHDATTPEEYFHLAAAYLGADRPGEAHAALAEAQALGLTAEGLHPLERGNYDRLQGLLAQQ